jgi:curli biogenesis system outer membrane secretion channel CsgG
MNATRTFQFAALMGIALLTAGCASVDQTNVQAKTGAPVSAQVEIASIPYNASLPRFVVAVLPLDYGASSGVTTIQGAPSADGSVGSVFTGGLNSGGQTVVGGAPGSQVGYGMAAQLITALTRCGNVSVMEPQMLQQQPDGTYMCKMIPGEVGPFIIKGAVTEFNEAANQQEKSRGGSLGLLGAAAGVAGAATGHSGLAWTGAGVAAANPTYENKTMRREGMVGMDLQLVDGRSGRIVSGYQCSGTFASESAVSGLSVFGIGGGDAQFASSALGQATRAAMNDAIHKTMNGLMAAPR